MILRTAPIGRVGTDAGPGFVRLEALPAGARGFVAAAQVVLDAAHHRPR